MMMESWQHEVEARKNARNDGRLVVRGLFGAVVVCRGGLRGRGSSLEEGWVGPDVIEQHAMRPVRTGCWTSERFAGDCEP